MRQAILTFFLIFSGLAQAGTEVLFHPHGPTLEKIAAWIGEARSNVDIAMYNMDVSDRSAVITTLKSDSVQRRLASGELRIRLIYEGYDTREGNQRKMAEIESLGVDVRYLGKSIKVHHKFAVIDGDGVRPRVITGSANWSLTSYRNYNENILFFENEPEPTYRFQHEFNGLWRTAREFGWRSEYESLVVAAEADQPDIHVHFNSARLLGAGEEHVFLSDQLIRVIDAAVLSIDIATTRIRIEKVLDAIVRAAARGVKVRIVLSQDDYHDLWRRAKWLFASPNIHLRVKFYNFRVSAYMAYQMHHKFMIMDRAVIMTGSFNWSDSGENQHIENLVEMWGPGALPVLQAYQTEFDAIWDLGRATLDEFKRELERIRGEGGRPLCAFSPISLAPAEIRELLKQNRNCVD